MGGERSSQLRLAALPIVLGGLGTIAGLSVAILPSPAELWPILVHYILFAVGIAIGILMLWPSKRGGRPRLFLMVVGIVALRTAASLLSMFTVATFATLGGGALRQLVPVYSATLSAIHGAALLLGASLAAPKLRSPLYLLISAVAAAAVSVAASSFPPPVQLKFLWVFVVDGVNASLLGFFLFRVASATPVEMTEGQTTDSTSAYGFRVPRLAYGLSTLFILIGVFGLVALIAINSHGGNFGTHDVESVSGLLGFCASVILIILSVGRYHDIGKSGAWTLLLFVPLVSLFVLLYLLFTPSAKA